MVKINSMSFGVIKIDGKNYRVRDVVIFPDGAVRRRRLGRWLASHHRYGTEDVTDLVVSGIDTVVIGTGVFSGVKLSNGIWDYAKAERCEIIELPSPHAIHEFNEQRNHGKRVGALIHVLC